MPDKHMVILSQFKLGVAQTSDPSFKKCGALFTRHWRQKITCNFMSGIPPNTFFSIISNSFVISLKRLALHRRPVINIIFIPPQMFQNVMVINPLQPANQPLSDDSRSFYQPMNKLFLFLLLRCKIIFKKPARELFGRIIIEVRFEKLEYSIPPSRLTDETDPIKFVIHHSAKQL